MATFYEELLRSLVDAEVRFVLVGGVAVILHGVPRTTADVDIVIDLDAANVDAFLSVMERLGFKPRAPVPARQFADPAAREQWRVEKGMRAFTFVRGTGMLEEVDVLIDCPRSYDELATAAVRIEAAGLSLHIATIDALIEMKSDTGRAQDECDIDALRRLKEALGDG